MWALRAKSRQLGVEAVFNLPRFSFYYYYFFYISNLPPESARKKVILILYSQTFRTYIQRQSMMVRAISVGGKESLEFRFKKSLAHTFSALLKLELFKWILKWMWFLVFSEKAFLHVLRAMRNWWIKKIQTFWLIVEKFWGFQN